MNPETTTASIPELRSALAKAPSASAHARLGTALLKAGNSREAEEQLRAALALDPKFAGAWVNLGGIHLARWDYQAAIEANRKAAEVEPGLALAHFNQAIAYLHLGDAENAVECLSKTVEIDPKHGAAFYHLGIALYALDRPLEAKACVAFSQELGFRRRGRQGEDRPGGAADHRIAAEGFTLTTRRRKQCRSSRSMIRCWTWTRTASS